MRPVALQELKQLGDGKHWNVEQRLSDLETLGPVKGWLKALHRGDDLWLEAEATATVELICDRCLKPYPQPLETHISESIALQSGGPDAEIEELDGTDAPLETLDPNGRFDPEHWLFEQLNLQLPLKRLCCPDCPGLIEPETPESAPEAVDPRWAQLLQLKSPEQP